MPLNIIYLLVRLVAAFAVLVFRRDLAKDAELLVLRHENAVLRRNAGRIRYEPAGRAWFTRSFDAVFQAAGTTILRTAVQAPRMNAACERLLGTLRRELIDRMLILSEAHLRAVLAEYQAHYNCARPRQGIAQRVPGCDREVPGVTAVNLDAQRINRKPVLGDLINEYSRAA